MNRKIVLVAFNGEGMCFVHVLLNALDMHEKGCEVKLVIEGSATKLVKELADSDKPFADLYQTIREKGMIDCVCQACASTTGARESAEAQGLTLCSELRGHPSLIKYREQGYEIMTF